MNGLNFLITENNNIKSNQEDSLNDIDKDVLIDQLRQYYYQQYKKTDDINFLSQALITTKDGTPITNHPVHKEILYFLEKHQGQNILIECCVNIGKTEQITMFYAQKLFYDNKKNSFIISQNQSTAEIRLARINFYMERLAKFENNKINYKKQTATAIDINGNIQKDPTCSAYGLAGGYNGLRVDYLIADDIETQANLPELQNNKEIFYNVFVDRKDAGSTITIINTPFHKNGLIKELESKVGWNCLLIGLNKNLIREKNYNNLLKKINTIDDIIIKTKLEQYINHKNLYDAIDFLKKTSYNEREDLIKDIYDCLDFRFIKREILSGEQITNTEYIEEWDYFKYEKGRDILDKFTTNYKSYLLSYALDTETAGKGEIFTHHENALIDIIELENIKKHNHYIFFSYDLAGEGRNGTVITEWLVINANESYITRQTKHDTIDAVKQNIISNLNKIHVIEINSQQKTVVKLIRDSLPENNKWIILEHTTTKQSLTDYNKGLINLEEKFYNKKIKIVKQGIGIHNLVTKLTAYNGIKTKNEQNDEVMSLWIGAYNITKVIQVYKIHENNQEKPIRKQPKLRTV
ncbi:MAG: hypothetical protein ACRC0A_07710 [Chitinophagaceae bacterium]